MAEEGYVLRVTAAESGLGADGGRRWSVESEVAECIIDTRDDLVCELFDQGELLLGLERLAPDGSVVATAVHRVDIANRAPSFDACPEVVHGFTGQDGDGTPAEVRVDYVVQDVPGDAVGLSLASSPEDCEVEDHLVEGWVLLTCPRLGGESELVVVAADDDGGEASCTTALDVGPARPETFDDWDDGSSRRGPCLGISFALAFLPLIPLIIRA